MGRFLSVRECLESPHTINFHHSGYSIESDYVVVENSPAEIFELVKEKLNQKEDYKYSNLQNPFVEKRKHQIKKWIAEEPFYKKWVDQGYRLAIRYYYKGTMGNKFLEDNWEYGEYLVRMTKRFQQNNLENL